MQLMSDEKYFTYVSNKISNFTNVSWLLVMVLIVK